MILRNQKVIGLYFRYEYNIHRIFRTFGLNLLNISTGCLKKTEFSQNQLWEIFFWLMRNPILLFLWQIQVWHPWTMYCNVFVICTRWATYLSILDNISSRSNIFVWLDMDTIGQCSFYQSFCPLQLCTWLPFLSFQALPSSPWQGQSGQ